MPFGVDVQNERDDEVCGRNEEKRAPVDDGCKSCSCHTRNGYKPRKNTRQNVGPHVVARTRLDEVVANNDNVDRDRCDQGSDGEGVPSDLGEDGDIGRGADSLDQSRVVRDLVSHSPEDGHKDVNDGCDRHAPADRLVYRDIGLFGISPGGYCGDEGVIEEDGTKGLGNVVTNDGDQGSIEAVNEKGDDPLGDDEEDEDKRGELQPNVFAQLEECEWKDH